VHVKSTHAYKIFSKLNLLRMHAMAYFIFLNSLESLEDFRKNPQIQILLNRLVKNSNVLPNSKLHLYLKGLSFLDFSPSSPSRPSFFSFSYPNCPCRPVGLGLLAGLAHSALIIQILLNQLERFSGKQEHNQHTKAYNTIY
jgi:hypothetical protein